MLSLFALLLADRAASLHLSASARAARPSLPPTIRCLADATIKPAAALVSWREEDDPETVVPEVSLTRSRDGSTGTATFSFLRPSCIRLNDVWNNGLITGLWLRDEEGTLSTTDLEVIFEKGSPIALKAILVLKNVKEWDRFMRFMQRYAEANDLEFVG